MDWIKGILDFGTDEIFLGISLRQYALAFLAIFLAFLFRKLFTSLVLRWLKRLASKTSTKLDEILLDAVGPPLSFAFVIIGLYEAAYILRLPTEPTPR